MDFWRSNLTVVYAPSAIRELEIIWEHNAESYGPEHEDDYVDFLQRGVDVLGLDPEQGKPVEGFPAYRRLTLKRTPRGHGHIVIYRLDPMAGTIRILHLYHSAQDIEGRLRRDLRQG